MQTPTRIAPVRDPIVEVAVLHDQGSSARCDDVATEGADSGDPRCMPQKSAQVPPHPPWAGAVVAKPASQGSAQPDGPPGDTSPSCRAGMAVPSLAALAMLLMGRGRRRGLLLALIAGLGAAACDDPPAPQQTLRGCLIDVWQSRLPMSCRNDCESDPTLAECGADDCEVRDFMWLRADDVAVEGYYRASRSRQVFSSAGLDVRTWSLEGDRVQISLREPETVHCEEAKMVLDSAILRVRAVEGTEQSLTDAFDENGWVAAPYLR